MSVLSIVTCDRCNAGGSLNTENGRGWVVADADTAVAMGWAREPGGHIDGTDDTHYCIDCLNEEGPTRCCRLHGSHGQHEVGCELA